MLIRPYLLPLAFLSAAATAAGSAAPAPAATRDFNEIAPIYTSIAWRDPLNPAFVPLGDDSFLVSTSNGIQRWDATTNVFTRVSPWPAYPDLLYGVHARIKQAAHAEGTLLAAGAGGAIVTIRLARRLRRTRSFGGPGPSRPPLCRCRCQPVTRRAP